MRYLRARDVQSATLPLVYVTCGGSNLPVRPSQKKRPSAFGAHAKWAVSRARSAAFGVGGVQLRPMNGSPTIAFRLHQNPEPHGAVHPKTSVLPTTTKIARRNRTNNDHQDVDNHGQWNDGLNRSTKLAPHFPHLPVFFVVVWHAFAYQVISQCATTLPWVGAWAPSVSGCQHTRPEQKKAPWPMAVLGPFGGNLTKIGRFSSAAKFHYSPLWWAIGLLPIWGVFF